MADVRTFTIAVGRWSKRLEQSSVSRLRALAISVLEGIVQATPVDTGRLRSNWNVAIGRADPTTTKAADPSGQHALTRGLAVIRSIKRIREAGVNRVLGDGIHITNGLPYAVPIEFGHSKQAPNGMVRVTLARHEGVQE